MATRLRHLKKGIETIRQPFFVLYLRRQVPQRVAVICLKEVEEEEEGS